MINYLDTRGGGAPVSFSAAVLAGMAPDGGLYVPESLPKFGLGQLISLGLKPYAQAAAQVYQAMQTDFPGERVLELMDAAYSTNFDTSEVCPIHRLGDSTYLLELWHGPTAAFKDMALQCLPLFFVASAQAQAGAAKRHLILVATSGDTGSAALAGFADRPDVDIIVFYPDGGVSPLQLLQMTTNPAANVYACAVRGNFDDCQTAVKQIFTDAPFNQQLAERYGVSLSSANSINWGRLLPQVVYYLRAYAKMAAEGAVMAGQPVDICVPTGNFGNILAAWYAGQMGLPLRKLVCASNENNVLYDFIQTGTYDISGRAFKLTASPAMDILVSSNLERLLFELSGHDATAVTTWMHNLGSTGRFTVDDATKQALQEQFLAGWADDAACFETIYRTYDKYSYLLDPHTAVAVDVNGQLVEHPVPTIVVSTAHWAKFGPDVWRALHGLEPGAALPAEVGDLSALEIDQRISSEYEAPIPEAIAALEGAQVRFDDISGGSREELESVVLRQLEVWK